MANVHSSTSWSLSSKIAVAVLFLFVGTAFAQESAPALLVAKVPSGDSGVPVAFSVPIPPLGTIKLAYNAEALSVNISGAITQRFAIYRKVFDEQPELLQCTSSALNRFLTFVGASSGTATCDGVIAGDVLYFVREDFVPEFLEKAQVQVVAADEVAGADEFVFSDTAPEEESSWFDDALGFFGFGDDEDEEAFTDEFAFEAEDAVEPGEDEFVFDESEVVADDEQSFFDDVADFFGFGEDEVEAPVDELVAEFTGESEDEFVFDESPEIEASGEDLFFGSAGEDELLIGDAERGAADESAFDEESGTDEFFAEEDIAGEEIVEEKLLPRVFRETKEAIVSAVVAVRNAAGKLLNKFYVKNPLPEGALIEDEFVDGEDGEFVDVESVEFVE